MVFSDGKKSLLSDGSYINNAVHSEQNCKYCRINLLERCWKTRERNKPSKTTQSCHQLLGSQSEPWGIIAISLMQLHSNWKKLQEDVSLCGVSPWDTQEVFVAFTAFKEGFWKPWKTQQLSIISWPSGDDLRNVKIWELAATFDNTL